MGSLDYLLLLCVASSSFWAGFRLGSTVRSETKGIWMWCVPHPSKENHILVLLDTEGLGDVEKVRQGIFFTPDTPLKIQFLTSIQLLPYIPVNCKSSYK